MEIFKEELKETFLATTAVRVYEKLIEQNAFLWAQRFSQNLELETNLLQLWEIQYLARYSDYMRIIPTRLRQHASETKTSDWELISGKHYWSDIASKLTAEDKNQRNIRLFDSEAYKAADYRTHAAVYNASRALGISEDLTIWSIIQYGLRNEKAHRELEALRAEGDFQQLAQVYSADLEDVDLVFSEFRT